MCIRWRMPSWNIMENTCFCPSPPPAAVFGEPRVFIFTRRAAAVPGTGPDCHLSMRYHSRPIAPESGTTLTLNTYGSDHVWRCAFSGSPLSWKLRCRTAAYTSEVRTLHLLVQLTSTIHPTVKCHVSSSIHLKKLCILLPRTNIFCLLPRRSNYRYSSVSGTVSCIVLRNCLILGTCSWYSSFFRIRHIRNLSSRLFSFSLSL